MSAPGALVVGESGERLAEMLALIKQSDSVELKLTVPESDQRSAVVALGLDPLEAQIRQVFFFDTPDLALDRARRRRPRPADPGQGRRLGREAAPGRAVRAARGAAAVRRASASRSTRCPGGYVCSGDAEGHRRARPTSARARRRAAASQAVLEGAAGVLRGACAGGDRPRRPRGPRPDLRAQAALTPGELGRRLVAEMWLYPDGSRVLELSTRCPTDRGVPGRRRAARLPRRARRRPLGRAADEDPARRSSTSRERGRRPDDAGIVPRWEWRTFGDALRRRRAPLRRADARARPGERRGLPALARARRLGQGPRRPAWT